LSSSTEYLFQLGSHPELSLAELESVCPQLEARVILNQQFAVVTNCQQQDWLQFLQGLGGTIRIARIFAKFELGTRQSLIEESLRQELQNSFSPDKKNLLGLSIFPPKNQYLIKKILLKLKKELKKDYSVRFINRNFTNLDAGTLHKEKIFTKSGGELVIVKGKSQIYLAETVAAQDVVSFSQRDFAKPQRDMQVGMLPVKLALMLLNFTRGSGRLPQSVYDPFCGTGTIISEAAFLQIPRLFASDLEPERVRDTEKNWQYFQEQFRLFSNLELFTQDASKPPSSPIEAEAICSETYLGPICKNPLSEKQFDQVKKQVEPIINNFFANLHKLFTGTTAVVAIPFWQLRGGEQQFLKNPLALAEKFWQTKTASKLLFKRPDQTVGRQILVLRKKK
jgi:tRNA G10  N-methylase Trm11